MCCWWWWWSWWGGGEGGHNTYSSRERTAAPDVAQVETREQLLSKRPSKSAHRPSHSPSVTDCLHLSSARCIPDSLFPSLPPLLSLWSLCLPLCDNWLYPSSSGLVILSISPTVIFFSCVILKDINFFYWRGYPGYLIWSIILFLFSVFFSQNFNPCSAFLFLYHHSSGHHFLSPLLSLLFVSFSVSCSFLFVVAD